MNRSRTQSLAFAALLAMAAIWGSTFFLIKDLATSSTGSRRSCRPPVALTPASVTGFVTGLYVVLTPLLGALVFRSRVDGRRGTGPCWPRSGSGCCRWTG